MEAKVENGVYHKSVGSRTGPWLVKDLVLENLKSHRIYGIEKNKIISDAYWRVGDKTIRTKFLKSLILGLDLRKEIEREYLAELLAVDYFTHYYYIEKHRSGIMILAAKKHLEQNRSVVLGVLKELDPSSYRELSERYDKEWLT